MAFCKNCGNQLPDDAAFCTNCGTPVEAAQQNTQQNVQQNTQQNTQQNVQPPVNTNGDVLPSDKGLAWLAYILGAPVFLVPLFVRRTSEYCQFHVKQGATLWAVHVVYWILTSIITSIIDVATRTLTWYGYVHNGVYWVFYTLFAAGQIFLCVLAIIGIVNAASGKKKELPLISKIPWIGMLIDKIYTAINK